MVLRWMSRAGLLGVLLALTTVAWRADGPNSTQVPTPVARHHDPIIIHERHGRNVTSTNWSGYAVAGAKGSVTDVKASWIVPAIAGTCPSTEQYSSFWVGIDGYSSNTVEQIGTDSDCQNGKPVYYAWYEFYPHPSFLVNGLTISPGDKISAEVSADAKGVFTVTLADISTGKTFGGSSKIPSAAQSSAEWIAEAPSSGGVLPLADFNVVDYGQDHTAVSPTCYTTIGRASGLIGSFPGNVEITMVNSSGATEALPSGLSTDGSSFSVGWRSSR
jgi:hypothetical protein